MKLIILEREVRQLTDKQYTLFINRVGRHEKGIISDSVFNEWIAKTSPSYKWLGKVSYISDWPNQFTVMGN